MSDPDKPLLLTGATGRLGRALLSRMGADASRVRAVVLPGDPLGPELIMRHGMEVHYGDLTQSAGSLSAATDGVDAVIHLAAQLPQPGVTSEQQFDSIVTGTFNLLGTVADTAPQTRFIYVSSSAVYGPQLPALIDPITEDHPIRPTSVYGAAKASAETFVHTYERSHGLQATIIRPSDIVVADDLLLPEGLIARRFTFDQDEGVIHVPIDHNGEYTILSLASADDIARGILLALDSERAIGEAYHLGPNVSPSDLDIAHAIARHHGWNVGELKSPVPARRWIMSASKAREQLHFEVEHDLDAILQERQE